MELEDVCKLSYAERIRVQYKTIYKNIPIESATKEMLDFLHTLVLAEMLDEVHYMLRKLNELEIKPEQEIKND